LQKKQIVSNENQTISVSLIFFLIQTQQIEFNRSNSYSKRAFTFRVHVLTFVTKHCSLVDCVSNRINDHVIWVSSRWQGRGDYDNQTVGPRRHVGFFGTNCHLSCRSSKVNAVDFDDCA